MTLRTQASINDKRNLILYLCIFFIYFLENKCMLTFCLSNRLWQIIVTFSSLAYSTKRIMLLEVSYPKLYMEKSCIRTIYVCINTMYRATKFPVSLEFIHFYLFLCVNNVYSQRNINNCANALTWCRMYEVFTIFIMI